MSKCVNYLGTEGFGVYEADVSRRAFRRVDGHAATLLVPGFVDIHIHGAFGIDFMTADPDQMSSLCKHLRAVGYEAFLPTTVSASAEDVTRALDNLIDDPMILGFNLEGPFISLKYPGAQPPSAIVNPPLGITSWETILDDARLKVVTLAPERPGASELINRLKARGVRVSMGHTEATYEDADWAYRCGADHTTHTFNAMRPLHHREAGILGYALVNDEIYTELIYDRRHVSRAAAEVLHRCKPEDRIVAVSDSTMAAGMSPGQTVVMWGLECVVGDREVRLKDGTLAGSAITLLDAFRNLHEDFGVEAAVRACCLNPRRSIGYDAPPKLYIEFDEGLEIVGLYEAAS